MFLTICVVHRFTFFYPSLFGCFYSPRMHVIVNCNKSEAHVLRLNYNFQTFCSVYLCTAHIFIPWKFHFRFVSFCMRNVCEAFEDELKTIKLHTVESAIIKRAKCVLFSRIFSHNYMLSNVVVLPAA